MSHVSCDHSCGAALQIVVPALLPANAMDATVSSLTGSIDPAAKELAPSSGNGAEISSEKAIEALQEFVANQTLGAGDIQAIQILIKDHNSLKEKVTKLKSLLGRSAKAQREAKVELEATQKRLDQSLREIDRQKQKIDKLVNRPTHMELLADFESNFDRALLSVQSGGQQTSSPTPAQAQTIVHESVDTLLMQELNDSKQRVDKLENLNSALVHRSSQLENQLNTQQREKEELAQTVARLELEKRMAQMEAEHATRSLEEKKASLQEMQLEIDLVTKASVKASRKASHEHELLKAVKHDKEHVQKLEAQVVALREWALASAEAKALAQERASSLERRLRALEAGNEATTEEAERIVWSLHGSLVVGAGDVGHREFYMKPEDIAELAVSERLVLRWKFDLTSSDRDVKFSIAKGSCDTPAKRRGADYLIKERAVKGGAAGETDYAFAVQNRCTMLWSNAHSWIQPRTIKYTVSAVAIAD